MLQHTELCDIFKIYLNYGFKNCHFSYSNRFTKNLLNC